MMLGGALKLHLPGAEELERAFELMEDYADLPMDFADASLVAAAETLGTRKIFTLDRRDFAVYRIRKGRRRLAATIVWASLPPRHHGNPEQRALGNLLIGKARRFRAELGVEQRVERGVDFG